MKKNIGISVLFFAAVLTLGTACSLADEAAKPSPELLAKGKALFDEKTGLGTKFACILCHKQDKAIKAAKVAAAGDKLSVVINKYIVEKSKGKPIAADSEEMKALIAYIKYEHAK